MGYATGVARCVYSPVVATVRAVPTQRSNEQELSSFAEKEREVVMQLMRIGS